MDVTFAKVSSPYALIFDPHRVIAILGPADPAARSIPASGQAPSVHPGFSGIQGPVFPPRQAPEFRMAPASKRMRPAKEPGQTKPGRDLRDDDRPCKQGLPRPQCRGGRFFVRRHKMGRRQQRLPGQESPGLRVGCMSLRTGPKTGMKTSAKGFIHKCCKNQCNFHVTAGQLLK